MLIIGKLHIWWRTNSNILELIIPSSPIFSMFKNFKDKIKMISVGFTEMQNKLNWWFLREAVPSFNLIYLDKHSKASHGLRIVLGAAGYMQQVKYHPLSKQLSIWWGWGRRTTQIHKEQKCKVEWGKCLKKGVNWGTGHNNHRDETLPSGVGICSVMWDWLAFP